METIIIDGLSFGLPFIMAIGEYTVREVGLLILLSKVCNFGAFWFLSIIL